MKKLERTSPIICSVVEKLALSSIPNFPITSSNQVRSERPQTEENSKYQGVHSVRSVYLRQYLHIRGIEFVSEQRFTEVSLLPFLASLVAGATEEGRAVPAAFHERRGSGENVEHLQSSFFTRTKG